MFANQRRQKAEVQTRLADLESEMAAIGRSQALITFDMNGTVLDANDNFLTTMGYRLDEVVGGQHRRFMDPVDAASADYAAFWRNLNSGQFLAQKFRRLARAGAKSGCRRPTIPSSGPTAARSRW